MWSQVCSLCLRGRGTGRAGKRLQELKEDNEAMMEALHKKIEDLKIVSISPRRENFHQGR